MRNLLKGILFGLLVGVVLGWWLAQKKHQIEEQSAEEAFSNNPKIKAHMAESRRMHQAERWIQELEDNDL
jgi:uncharacterized protein YneF (UPF0154 family)